MSDSYASRRMAMSQLRESEKGQAIVRQSKISAVNYLFDLEGEERNPEASQDLSPIEIYDAIELTGKLTINVNGKDYSLVPYYSELESNEELALEMLADVQSNLEISMLESALPESSVEVAMLTGVTAGEIMDVDLTDYVGEYDTPDDVPEWIWIKDRASFVHKDNGNAGIWDHIVNVSLDHGPVPPTLKPLFEAAKAGEFHYILFHQGT